MDSNKKTYKQITLILIFFVLPVLFYVLGDSPRRTVLKEMISLATILAFLSMIMQIYLTRASMSFFKDFKKAGLVKWHKVLAYIFIGVLLAHPLLIVLPRFFEAGIEPQDAFLEILSNFNKQGLFLGLLSWSTMFIIGITAFFRDKLPFSYKTWRFIHGILSITFIITASFHVIDLGRHINTPMTLLISILSIIGIASLLRIYVFKTTPSKNK